MGKTRTRLESKSDSKFEKKLEFYAKVKDAVASLNAQTSIKKKQNKQRRRQKKLRAYDLSSLSESLPELKVPRKPTLEENFKLNSKSRGNLILNEGKRLCAVLNHSAFQSYPLSAIHQHLHSTQPVVEEQPKKKVNKIGSKKKEKKLKASDRPQSMDM